ncbi:hypothetical protein CMI45_01910 [Candidatus Pacearchaeota archaeon]|jgi:uncharacterized membrane protein (UPF0127 family)|nr:hypothetical protein [Candidatus Pacearchaeota archaeon]|tara:strand:+ start:1734 stop:2072 length:339 start_codon:yes stop_codon:yes gene_type:complete
MKIYYNKKEIEVPVRSVSGFGKISGLMFRSRETENLLFDLERESRMAIHSYFVFFPFLAVWLDGENRVLEFRKVRSFTFSVSPEKKFRKLVEIPINSENEGIIEFLVGRRKV